MGLSRILREKIESIPVDNNYKLSNATIKDIENCLKGDVYQFRNKYYDFHGKEVEVECVVRSNAVKTKKGFRTLYKYNKRKFESYYGKLSTINNVDGNLLFRTYEVYTYSNYQAEWTYTAQEVERQLITDNGQEYYFSLPRLMGYYGTKFNHSAKIRYRVGNNCSHDYISVDRVISKPKFIFKYLNLRNLEGYIYSFVDLLAIPKPIFETVLKHSQTLTRIYTRMRISAIREETIVKTIKMIIRSKAKPCVNFRIDSYIHFIHLCEDLNKQFTPDVIWTNWKEYNTQFEKQWKKEQAGRELKENIANFQEKYIEEHKALIGYTKNYDKFRIDFLNSVKDFKEEADSMCHCVYRMGYYKEPNSWIFSIKDLATGKRLETCELVNKGKELKINQCYGYGDKFTEQHDNILNVMNLLIKAELKGMINNVKI